MRYYFVIYEVLLLSLKKGRFALMEASKGGHLKVVELLLERGINIEEVDKVIF